MKLRNKKTGEICELGHIRQAWREGKDGGMGYMLLKANDNNGIIYNSLAEMMDEWEDYKPKEPLIKDEGIRKAVRAWAEANNINSNHYYETNVKFSSPEHEFTWIDTSVQFNEITGLERLEDGKRYTIAELCGEVEE